MRSDDERSWINQGSPRVTVPQSILPTSRLIKQYQAKQRAIGDPTTLILVDEADRLQMNSLKQMRSIFDEGTAGLVLIGMPGIEKRVARFPTQSRHPTQPPRCRLVGLHRRPKLLVPARILASRRFPFSFHADDPFWQF